MSRRRVTAVTAGLVLAAAVAAGAVVSAGWGRPAPVAPAAATPTRSPAPTPPVVRSRPWTVLSVGPAALDVFNAPGGRLLTRLANPNRYGKPLVLLAVAQTEGWWYAELPIRPNGSRGWVRAQDVSAAVTPYAVEVYLGAHRLDVLDGDRLVLRVPIAVGTSDSPTPGGRYYLTMLFKVDDASGPYGPWAFGISGYSDVYQTFGAGLGEIGIHGTDEPWLVGQDVSHGCIRLRNPDITRLAHLVPVGAPVVIHA